MNRLNRKVEYALMALKYMAGKPAGSILPMSQPEPLTQMTSTASPSRSRSAEPMNCQEMIKGMAEKGYWTSPGGQTPHATLYSAILRELKTKGTEARFRKTERGTFAANPAK